MLFSRRLSLSDLVGLCRVLRHYLGAGMTLTDVFRQQAARGPATVRPVATRIATHLGRGDDLEHALRQERDAFPPLLLSLASVGERTGMLPEVFAELEKYFLRQQQLRRQFVAQTAWPLIQFFLAVFVLAGLIFVLGLIQPAGITYDPLGLGLFGASGATLFLGVVFGFLLVLAGLYLLLTRALAHRAGVDAFLLRLPALGPCLRALALGRFCLALRLTTETAMPVGKALALSLRATGNTAFAAAAPAVQATVRKGDDVTLALAQTKLFPHDFQQMMAVAEESGRFTDVLRHQGDHYQEEAGRRLKVLTGAASYAVWALVGIVLIAAIFKLYLGYFSALAGL